MKSAASLWIILVALLFSCGKNSEKQARELVGRSIAAHGGTEAWEEIATLKFRKKTRLYHEDGTLESELDQKIEFRFKPRLEGEINWVKDSITHVIIWDGDVTRYFMGENEVKNPGFLASKKKEFEAAVLAVGAPWRILDQEAALGYEGQKTLENERLVKAVRLDSTGVASQIQFYFDPNSAMMVGSETQSGSSPTLTYNLGYAEVGGLKLPGQSESWALDESGRKRFLRAEFLYSEYEVLK